MLMPIVHLSLNGVKKELRKGGVVVLFIFMYYLFNISIPTQGKFGASKLPSATTNVGNLPFQWESPNTQQNPGGQRPQEISGLTSCSKLGLL